MADAYIVDAVRTAGGRRGGKLAGVHPVDLGAAVLDSIADRNDFDPAAIEDVIMGCVMQGGEQAGDVGRNIVLASRLPNSIPSVSIDRQCGSSQQSMMFAAQGVMAGAYDVVVAAGVEVMSRVPMGSSIAEGKFGFPFGQTVQARYAADGGLVNQGISAELIAEKWKISREDMDRYGVRSQSYAARATQEGRFQNEIIPTLDAEGKVMTTDEGIRESTLEKLATLKPAYRPIEDGGKVTAGNSSQITDGATAVLIMSEERAKQLGLKPRARFVNFALAAENPRYMLTAPIPATKKVLERAGLKMSDIDLVEINEAFASVVLAWEKELHPDMEKVNVNGGAIALGHPLGCTGAKLTATLMHEMKRRQSRYGMVSMCIGGGMGAAGIFERM